MSQFPTEKVRLRIYRAACGRHGQGGLGQASDHRRSSLPLCPDPIILEHETVALSYRGQERVHDPADVPILDTLVSHRWIRREEGSTHPGSLTTCLCLVFRGDHDSLVELRDIPYVS